MPYLTISALNKFQRTVPTLWTHIFLTISPQLKGTKNVKSWQCAYVWDGIFLLRYSVFSQFNNYFYTTSWDPTIYEYHTSASLFATLQIILRLDLSCKPLVCFGECYVRKSIQHYALFAMTIWHYFKAK